MKKYPRIPHIPGSNATDDDLVLRSTPVVEDSYGGEFTVYEKLDGASLGISWDETSWKLRLQNRGGYLEDKRDHPQWDAARNWAAKEYLKLMVFFEDYPGYTVFGEWLYAQHSIYYDRLPSLFIAYDVWDGEKFLENVELMLWDYGFVTPKSEGTTFNPEKWIQENAGYIGRYGYDYEGFIFRRRNEIYKWVRPGFLPGTEEHWFNKPVVKNKVVESV